MPLLPILRVLSVLVITTCFVSASANSGGEGTGPKTSEYGKKTTELRNLESKIKDCEETIEKMVEKKNHTEDLEQKKLAMKEMVEKHEELKKHTIDYNRLRMELKYKFPGKGEEIEARYHSKKTHSLEEMEHKSSLDAQLARTKKVVIKKYEPLMPKVTPSPSADNHLHEKEADTKGEPPRFRLER